MYYIYTFVFSSKLALWVDLKCWNFATLIFKASNTSKSTNCFVQYAVEGLCNQHARLMLVALIWSNKSFICIVDVFTRCWMIGCVCRCGRTFMISNLPRSKILQGNRDQAAGGGAMHWLLGAIYAMGWAVPLSMQNTNINRRAAMYHIKGKEYTSTWLTWLIGLLCFLFLTFVFVMKRKEQNE